MKEPKYHIYLMYEERKIVINDLIKLRNKLITEGRYTDLVDDLIIKLSATKPKNIKIRYI